MSPSHLSKLLPKNNDASECNLYFWQSADRLPVSWCACTYFFHMTLIIHQKVKGTGMMNFKCQQEDHCCEDKLVAFPSSKLFLSLLGSLLLAVTGPMCLYQHLTTIFLSHTHEHTHKHPQ